MRPKLFLLVGLFITPAAFSQNVGVGTATPDPTRALTVKSTDDRVGIIALQNKDGQTKWRWDLPTAGLNLAEADVASDRLFVGSGGEVGIGTTTPEDKLDVHGDVRFRDQVKMGYQIVSLENAVGKGESKSFDLSCPDGYHVLAGGGGHKLVNQAAAAVQVLYSGPNPNSPATSWRVHVQNQDTGSGRGLMFYCICARIGN